jgi:hypothetical protein
LKVFLYSLFAITYLAGASAFSIPLKRIVPKDVYPFYCVVLFILAPLLLIRPTYWVSSLGVEIPYVVFYFLFFTAFIFLFIFTLYFIAVYFRWIKRKEFGHRLVDEYPMGAGTVLVTLSGTLVIFTNYLFY